MSASPVVHVGPFAPQVILDAVTGAGARLGPLEEADVAVWMDWHVERFPALPERLRWVQFPGAGVEQWTERIHQAPGVTFTSAVGVFARPVAAHALALLMAGVHRLVPSARATEWRPIGWHTLEGRTVAIVGAGAIGRALIELLLPLRARPIAVTRRGLDVPGAVRTYAAADLDEVWPIADHVVLAAPSTDATRHLVGDEQLRAMRRDAWLVNVGRGPLVDTDALVLCLRRGGIAGAALDVVDPEPLPDGHPLWREPRALISPHPGPAPADNYPHLAERVGENLRRFVAGEPLIGVIDAGLGY